MILDTFNEDLKNSEKLYIDEMEEAYQKGQEIIDLFLKEITTDEKK